MTEDLIFPASTSVDLTVDEQHALELAETLANTLGGIVGWGPTRDRDLGELHAKLRDIQHAVMAQSLARAYPEQFALLGGAAVAPPEGTTT